MKKNLFYKWGFVALLALSMTWVGCEDDEDVPDPTYEAGTWFYSTLIDKVSHRDRQGHTRHRVRFHPYKSCLDRPREQTDCPR